jgi:hypothetical protein
MCVLWMFDGGAGADSALATPLLLDVYGERDGVGNAVACK